MGADKAASAPAGSDGYLDAIGREIAHERYRVDAHTVAEAMLRRLALLDRGRRILEGQGPDPATAAAEPQGPR